MTLWVGTSWKMNKLRHEALDYVRALRAAADPGWSGVQPFVIPPATALDVVRMELEGSGVLLGAQNAHWSDAGAWTGEISVPQIKDAGAELVEIGHSERREHFGETDRTVNLKVRSTLEHGLVPLVCVGEPEHVLLEGRSKHYVLAQVEAALCGIEDTSRVLVAYEPIWAIGSGGRPAAAEDVADVFEELTRAYAGRISGALYGGSVSPGNSEELLDVPGVHGLFVGRSAWDVDGFVQILDLAARRAALAR